MSTDVEHRLAQVYGASNSSALSQTYDDWAASYDEDMLATGYAHPAVICGLTARYVPHLASPILDAGVGTGNIGQLLHTIGYSNLVGLDMSPGMLARAKARGVYASLLQGVLGERLDLPSASHDAMISTGTFTTGHAPAAAFDELARVVRPGGHLIFTVGTTVWVENGFHTKLASLCAQGVLRPVWESPIYHPMPHSKTEAHFTTRAHVYQRV
ncbi:MAG: class I SAM-dependent methyltransferase [Alphaproteobacteria bacterium]|nr:class I SAM-dependent methyltransferase [Alphaproteobacteria bacterium]